MIESITVEQVLTPKGWLENQTITADSGKIVSISDATSAAVSYTHLTLPTILLV